jgi:type I restriction enzyme, R subunit
MWAFWAHLTDAINTYSALSGFEQKDLEGTITPIKEVAEKLPKLHQKLWNVFENVKIPADKEAMEKYLRAG